VTCAANIDASKPMQPGDTWSRLHRTASSCSSQGERESRRSSLSMTPRNDPIHISSSPMLLDVNEPQRLSETATQRGPAILVPRSSSVASAVREVEERLPQHHSTIERTIITAESCDSEAATHVQKTEAIKLYERAKTLALDDSDPALGEQQAISGVHSHPSLRSTAGSQRQELAQALAEKLKTAEDRINRDLRFDNSRDSLNNVRPSCLLALSDLFLPLRPPALCIHDELIADRNGHWILVFPAFFQTETAQCASPL
jgi:hypothetical protein